MGEVKLGDLVVIAKKAGQSRRVGEVELGELVVTAKKAGQFRRAGEVKLGELVVCVKSYCSANFANSWEEYCGPLSDRIIVGIP